VNIYRVVSSLRKSARPSQQLGHADIRTTYMVYGRRLKATPVLVAPESGRAQKVAFLAKDGAFVKKGEVVVEGQVPPRASRGGLTWHQ